MPDERTLITGGNPDERCSTPSKFEFGTDDFLPASSLEKIGDALIRDASKGLGDLLEHAPRIKYAWRKKGAKKGDKTVLGVCTKAGGLVKHFGEADYVITLAADACAYLTRWQLEAAVYHELLHIAVELVEEEGKEDRIVLSSRTHDVELFLAEVDHYGLWRRDLESARTTFEQVPLPLGDASSRAA